MFSQKPQLSGGNPDPENKEAVRKALMDLGSMLSTRKYVASDHVTIADICILASVTFLELFDNFSLAEFDDVEAWVEQLKKELTYYDSVNKGYEQCKQSFTNTSQ